MGEIYPPKEGAEFGLILEKGFTDKMEWAAWCRNFSENPLYGYSDDESTARVLLNKRLFKKVVLQQEKVKAQPTKKMKRQNICGKCGEKGHNARTCRNQRK